MFFLENANAATQQVNVVKAFLEDNSALEDAVPLILVVDNEDLVRFILVNAELGKDLVALNVLSWEADRILNVRLVEVSG